MKNNGKWFYIFEAVLAVMVIILAVMMKEKNGEDLNRISVVIQNSEDSQWAAFRYGLKMAAQDQEIELVIASTPDTMTEEEEISAINQEIEHGADAVIVQPVSGKYLYSKLQKLQKKALIMLVESDASAVQDDSRFPVVGPDHYAMGRALAEELLNDYNGNLKGKAIGIITEQDGQHQGEAVRRRKQGFEDALKGTGAIVRWTVSGSVAETGEIFLEEQSAVDLAVALDDHSLIVAGQYAEANNLHGALVYGIGNSTEAIYGLDIGAVECLIVPDTFSMGYQSVTQTVQSLKRYFHKMEGKTVSFTAIRREELFLEKNQEILFTMSQ